MLAAATTAAAPPEGPYEKQLQRLRVKMQALQAEINRDRSKRDETREALHRSEREIGAINAKLRALRTAIEQKNTRIKELNADRERQQQRLQTHTDVFSRTIYATYVMGRQGYVKMLLNQEDPAKLGRAITYYRYLARARSQQIEAVRQSLAALQQSQERLDKEQRELVALQQTQLESRRALRQKRKERAALLAKLEARILSQNEELASLHEHERRLETLLAELAEMMRELPATLKAEIRFGDMKGRLALPVKGTIGARFNQQKKGNLRWQGLFLKAPEDRVVRAVFHGRVAFADWLRGFGLLLIIDHGDGYMSLYSHNKLLYKEVGDWVDTGNPIAVVGNSGGLSQTGLYFEIRHNGKPRNPLLWCKAG